MKNKNIFIFSGIILFIGLTCLIISLLLTGNKYTIKERLIENLNDKNSITIKYPSLDGDSDFSDINNEFVTIINQYLMDFYEQQLNNLSLEMDYRITRKDNKLLSVVFEGLGYVEQTAHPNDHLFTVNMNISTGKRMVLSDFYKLNLGFVEVLKANLISQNSEVEEILSNYTDDELLSFLTSADKEDGNSFSYLTDKAIGISLPIAYPTGDHVETEILFKDLQDFQLMKLE